MSPCSADAVAAQNTESHDIYDFAIKFAIVAPPLRFTASALRMALPRAPGPAGPGSLQWRRCALGQLCHRGLARCCWYD